MGCFIRVPMPKVPEGATQADRERMFREYVVRLSAANPHLQNGLLGQLKHTFAIGARKR